MTHVSGTNHDFSIRIYTLSTCGWCRKTKKLLNDLGVTYDYIDVDLLNLEQQAKTKEELRSFNPRTSYPTIVIDNEPIIGYDKEMILKKLNMSDPDE